MRHKFFSSRAGVAYSPNDRSGRSIARVASVARAMPGLDEGDLTEEQHRRIDRLRALARLLDSSFTIPGTQISLGIDPIIGLVPGFGDLIGGVFSSYIIYEAARLGVPQSTLVRMVFNLAIDMTGGLVPVVGDLFDLGWKTNSRNLALLERHFKDHTQPRSSREVAALVKKATYLVLALLGLLLASMTAVFVWIVREIIG